MEDLRGTPLVEIMDFLDDARDLYSKYGNLGKSTLKKLLDPINGSPNPHRIADLNSLFEKLFITDLEELIRKLEIEIERRQSPSDLKPSNP